MWKYSLSSVKIVTLFCTGTFEVGQTKVLTVSQLRPERLLCGVVLGCMGGEGQREHLTGEIGWLLEDVAQAR